MMHASGALRRKRAKPPAGRPRKASELAAELVIENADEIRKSFRTVLKTGSSAQKLKATELLLKTALSAERLDTIEHKTDLQHQSREELLDLLADKLNNSMAGYMIRARMAELNGVIEGTATPIE